MIISNKSYLRNPPVTIEQEDIAILDAIRFSLDICELSFDRLKANLSLLTEKKNPAHKDFPQIFSDIWSIINNSVIFYKISSREFNLSNNEPYFTEILKAKSLRDSNQHIDERLSQVLKNNDYPVYGSLSWEKHYLENDNIIFSAIYSGSFTNRSDVELTIKDSESIEEELDDVIQQIKFSSVARKGKKPNFYFENQKISINKLISDLKLWADHFDKQMEEQMKDFDTTERHKSDFIIKLGAKKISV